MMSNDPIIDERGRVIAPPQTALERPAGPWDENAENPRAILRGAGIRQALADERPIRPFAVFAFLQPGFDEFPAIPIYTIFGGENDRSSVSAERLIELGIEVPSRDVAPFADLPQTPARDRDKIDEKPRRAPRRRKAAQS